MSFTGGHKERKTGGYSLPQVTSGLACFLDATDVSTITKDGSNNISAMTDKSGAGFDWAKATSHQPLYVPSLFNNRGGIRFTYAGGNGLLSNAAASDCALNAYTLIVAGIRTGTKLATILTDQGSGGGLGITNYNGRLGYGQAGHTLTGVPLNTLTLMGVANTGDIATTKFFDQSGTSLSIGSTVPSSSNAMGNLTLGAKDFSANNGIDFDFAGMLLYNRTLNAAEIQQAIDFMIYKYQIPRLSTPRHNIFFSGDSVSLGFSADTGSAFAEIACANAGFTAYDFQISAIGGQQVTNANTTDTTYVDPQYTVGKKNIILLTCGTNDIDASVALATIKTRLTTYVTNRRAAGFKVGVATVLPRSGSSNASFNTVRAQLNTWIVAGNTGADYVIDIASDPTMGPDAAASDTSLYGDGTHPTAAGHAILASYYENALYSLLAA